MRAIVPGLLALLLAGQAAAAEPRQFDIVCRDVTKGPQTTPTEGRRYKIDLDRGAFCQPWTYDAVPKCRVRPLREVDRWIDLSYAFSDDRNHYEMYRVYDRKSGWMDQVLRVVGEPGTPHGDAVCSVAPFTGFTPLWEPGSGPATPDAGR